jgi:DNA-binding NarL/FixJ family response regulator
LIDTLYCQLLSGKEREMVRVLIADDSTPIRERIIKLLSILSDVEIVGEAIDGIETAVLAHKTQPDVVILDLHMPKLSGLEILPRLKELDPEPVVLVLTNYSSGPMKAMCTRNGADFFFDKSTEFEKAIAVIEGMCTQQAQGVH